jgi:hypothetical protein
MVKQFRDTWTTLRILTAGQMPWWWTLYKAILITVNAPRE